VGLEHELAVGQVGPDLVRRAVARVQDDRVRETVDVCPPREQVSVQATVASWSGVDVTPTVSVAGPTMVWVLVQEALAPDASQKPATLAVAASMVAVTAPAARRPATIA
jgi:hypothetical protein